MSSVPSKPKLPGSLDTHRRLSQWMRLEDDGTVTVFTGKVELGQGILTALAQIVADELDVPLEKIRMVPADTDLSPEEGVTSGSLSIQMSGAALRQAAAELRENWVEPDREANGRVKSKPADELKVVGTSVPRLDLSAKFSGQASYVHDMELPGMLHARVVRPAWRPTKLLELDEAAIAGMPGVAKVVREGSFVGVLAEREEQAIRAMKRAQRLAKWEAPKANGFRGPRDLLSLPETSEVIFEKGQKGSSAQTLEAEYTRPFIAHASIGPSCAVAQLVSGKLTVWSHSQSIGLIRDEIAQVLAMEKKAVRVIHAHGAGCYGHNGADDCAFDAALLARAMPGRPVKLQWMREDEFAWEPYGSTMLVRLAASLDTGGRIVDWRHDVWSHGHSTRPGATDGVTAAGAVQVERGFKASPPRNAPLPPGGSHRNAIPLYAFPSARVVNHLVSDPVLRVSALRALGGHANVFAIESFMDELASAAGIDPVSFRLSHLEDGRAKQVIQAVAELSGMPPNSGIAFAKYKNLGCYVAVVAQVDADAEIRVPRVWAAVDAGLAINPDGVSAQVEGGIVQSLSWALKEQVLHEGAVVQSLNWNDYPIATFEEVPRIEVKVLQRRELPPVGAGEGAIGPTTAAIANGVFAALGARVRDLPITRERVITALSR